MGWMNRKGKRYYYENRREGGRVVSRYVGAGALGECAEQRARDERRETQQQREQQREQERAAREECEALSRAVAAFSQEVDAVLRECLEQAGYHRHDRGAWRKRRKGVDDGEGSGNRDR